MSLVGRHVPIHPFARGGTGSGSAWNGPSEETCWFCGCDPRNVVHEVKSIPLDDEFHNFVAAAFDLPREIAKEKLTRALFVRSNRTPNKGVLLVCASDQRVGQHALDSFIFYEDENVALTEAVKFHAAGPHNRTLYVGTVHEIRSTHQREDHDQTATRDRDSRDDKPSGG